MSVRERLYRFRSFWVFPLVMVLLLTLVVRGEPQRQLSDLIWLFAIGALVWTLLEYCLHRFVFHIRVPIQDPRFRELVNLQHLEHHARPRDPEKVLVRPGYGLAVSAILYGLFFLVTQSVFSAAGLIMGVWAGFLYYEAVHYRVHFSLSGSGLIARQRRAHFYHHFTNNKLCFGVTSSLWDHVFGTLPK